jgi:hypothetical protein
MVCRISHATEYALPVSLDLTLTLSSASGVSFVSVSGARVPDCGRPHILDYQV